MKKLLSIICCLLYLRSFAKAPTEAGTSSQNNPGEKVLIKALAVIVNPDGNRKTPAKTVSLSPAESLY